MIADEAFKRDLRACFLAAAEVVRQEHERCTASLAVAPQLRADCEARRGRADAWRCIARYEVLQLEASLERLAVGALDRSFFEAPAPRDPAPLDPAGESAPAWPA